MCRLFLFFFSLGIIYSSSLLAQEPVAGSVVIHADPRLAILLRKHAPVVRTEVAEPKEAGVAVPIENATIIRKMPVVLYSGKGYRVQIYNGADRNRATAIKAEFMRRFPGVHTYLTFIAPSYRVKVGDYRSRAEAESMFKEANAIYHPSMIVPDDVTVTGVQ
ncbi:MAG: SPOR domain-containing protein [Bacteroidota bacterium]